MASDEGFLSRWSRRKAQVKGGGAAGKDPHPSPLPQREREPVLPLAPDTKSEPASLSALAASETGGERPALAPAEREVPRPPTMDDVALLTPECDYSRFVAPGVDEGVKRAAMKKLFSDPRFNVMDGLDVYIEDYNKWTPIPESELRQMAQAKVLRLFESDEAEAETHAGAGDAAKVIPDGASPAQLSQSEASLPDAPAAVSCDPSAVTPNEDPDLRLQPDDAAGRPGPDAGARTAGR